MPLNAKDMTGSSVLMCVDDEFRPLLLPGDQRTVASAVMGWAEAGLTVRVVRGRKMRNLPGLFDEFSAALQFPLYFGENEDAFDECIADLENLPAGEPASICFTKGRFEIERPLLITKLGHVQIPMDELLLQLAESLRKVLVLRRAGPLRPGGRAGCGAGQSSERPRG